VWIWRRSTIRTTSAEPFGYLRRMRARDSLAFLVITPAIALAACGTKDGGSAEHGSGAPAANAAEVAPSHASDEQLRTLPVPELAAGARADNIPDGPLVVIGADTWGAASSSRSTTCARSTPPPTNR
jgi:hypothetical protein